MDNLHLICLPFAGAGASTFQNWQALSDKLNIQTLDLPARERRFTDKPYRTMAEAVRDLYAQLLDKVETDTAQTPPRVCFFGHSYGAVLAFELAKACREDAENKIKVEHLFVSGSPGPYTQRERKATGLDEEAFLERVEEFAGYNHPALAHPEMRALLMPALRADVEMHENYYPTSNTKLNTAVTSILGTEDELVTVEDAEQWRDITEGSSQVVELPGNHMYLTASPESLIQLIESNCGEQLETLQTETV